MHYNWPFNVRELESCIKRGVALAGGNVLDAPQLPDAIAEYMKGYGSRTGLEATGPVSRSPIAAFSGHSPPVSQPLPTRRGPPSEEELRDLLMRHHGNIAAVGRELGKERMQVHRWLKKYNIDLEKYR